MDAKSLFADCRTLHQARKKWIELSKKHHPDISPQDEETMKMINEAYDMRVGLLTTDLTSVCKFYISGGRLVTMSPLKGKHIKIVLPTWAKCSELGLCHLLSQICEVDDEPIGSPEFVHNMPFHDFSIIANNFFRHNFKQAS